MTVASTPALESDRQALIALIGEEAVFHGDFTLSSGKKATYYVDMRKLTLDHRAAPAIGRLVLDPYSSTLYSSSPQVFASIDRKVAAGLTMAEAIEEVSFPGRENARGGRSDGYAEAAE